ncbi:FAD-dependent oxidoreductase [Priestia filamentosa]|uniref:NAD(P)/FAD-dependent oxidoreductase n=1 Tax=Priestia filamentosa TaxID=1402861 RepID=UPI001FB27A5A|nr:FAD-dependent oxidoreductase [Priestia filamentosa]MED3726283.1 FAD-dependent oxidoreductase [Priestia filamentosa]UOE59271.1 FAD-dependent oxidoreductase [Priestia filamentosa]
MIDLVIVGAGPAGLGAAISAAENGLKVYILDEFVKPGGRLLGQLHEEPDGKWVNGIEEAQKLYDRAIELGVNILCGVSVYDLVKSQNGWCVYTTDKIIESKCLLLATGASETPIPIPGWTLPGVMSIGAAQVMGNVHRVKAGEKGVIIGVNVLSVAISRELQLCGVRIENILLPPPSLISGDLSNPEKMMESLLRLSHLAPSPLIRFGGKWVSPKLGARLYPKNGFKMWGIPIQLRKTALEIVGEEQVEGVRIANISATGTVIPGTEKVIEADFVCIAGGLTPMSELAAVAGCSFSYVPELGGHVPLHNERMQTNLKGLYVAGNITGVESAKVAKAQGNVAGLSVARELNALTDRADEKINEAIKQTIETRRKALIQFNQGIEEAREALHHKFYESKDKRISI